MAPTHGCSLSPVFFPFVKSHLLMSRYVVPRRRRWQATSSLVIRQWAYLPQGQIPVENRGNVEQVHGQLRRVRRGSRRSSAQDLFTMKLPREKPRDENRPACKSLVVRRTLKLRAGCRKPVRRYVAPVRSDRRTRTSTCPVLVTEISRLSKRHSGEQRSTPPPHHASGRRLSLMGGPFGEQALNPMRPDPGRGQDPPGFSARNPGKSLTMEPIIAGPPVCCKGADPIAYSHATARRQEFDRVNLRLLNPSPKARSATVRR